jgi:hypothetical protein
MKAIAVVGRDARTSVFTEIAVFFARRSSFEHSVSSLRPMPTHQNELKDWTTLTQRIKLAANLLAKSADRLMVTGYVLRREIFSCN